MKIAYVLDKFMIGGGLYFIYRLAKKVKSEEFGIFAKGGENKLIDELRQMENVKVFDGGYSLSYIRQKFDPEIIHVNHVKPLFSILKLPFRRIDIPVIYTARGLHVRKYKFMGGAVNEIKYFLRKNLEKYLFNRTKIVVAVSQGDCDFLKNTYGISNCRYIPNGIEIENFNDGNKKGLRKRLNLPENKFLIVTVARFDFQKGYDVLINGIYRIQDIARKKSVLFVFVGGGSEFEKIRQNVKSMGIDDLILFTGEVPNGKEYIKVADIFLLTSRWEGLPTVVIEAGMFNKPVIASSAPGTKDIVKHYETGLTFENENPEDLANILETAILGKCDLREFAQNLHRHVVENYNIDLTIKRYLSLYREFLRHS